MTITSLLLASLLSSSSAPLVRAQQGTTVRSPSSSFVLSLPSESVHVYWRGALIDKSGTAWSQAGTVPQVARSGLVPPGAGVFSAANYYATASASDPMDTAGDFSGCVLVNLPDVTTVQQVAVDGVSTGNGWSVYVAAAAAYFVTYAAGAANSVNTISISTGLNVICFGRSGTTQVIKVNLDAAVSNGTAKQAGDATNAARIGAYTTNAAPLLGYVHEFVFGPVSASDATFIATVTRAKAKLGTAW